MARILKQFTLNSLRKNIGVVQQDVYLFLVLCLRIFLMASRGLSLEEVMKAAKLAGAHQFIKWAADGLWYLCWRAWSEVIWRTEAAISIARVFLKNPAILILDEATSALIMRVNRWCRSPLRSWQREEQRLRLPHRFWQRYKMQTAFWFVAIMLFWKKAIIRSYWIRGDILSIVYNFCISGIGFDGFA